MPRARAEEGLVWKNGFLFVGNHLALDFLNTQPVQDGQPVELLPDFASLLRWFQTAGLLSPRDAAGLKRHWGQSADARRTVEAMRGLRERLRKEILTWEGGGTAQYSTIDELNRLMAAYPMRAQLKKKSGKELLTELYFKPQRPEDLFAPLAHAAAMLFANTNRDRVRKCDQCVLHFVDTSKKCTRRWVRHAVVRQSPEGRRLCGTSTISERRKKRWPVINCGWRTKRSLNDPSFLERRI
jgi:predicted RNA-binding Zn ribbon-like protein